MSVNSSLAHCTIALFRLSVFEYPGWDLRLVQETCHLPTILDRALAIFSQVKTVVGLDPETPEDISMFAAACKRISAIKTRAEAKFANLAAASESTTVDAWNTQMVDIADEAWLRDLLVSEDFRMEDVMPLEHMNSLQTLSA